MDLEDLVTSSLPEGLEGKEPTVSEASEEEYSPAATLSELQAAREAFPGGKWQGPISRATTRLMRRYSDRGFAGKQLLIPLLEEFSGEKTDLAGAIEAAIDDVSEDEVFSSWERTVEYIQDEWGKEAAKMLSTCTGVKVETSKKWLQGSSLAERKRNRVRGTVLTYREAEKILGKKGARIWLETPEEDGTSPLEKIALAQGVGSRWIPWDARQALRRLEASEV